MGNQINKNSNGRTKFRIVTAASGLDAVADFFG